MAGTFWFNIETGQVEEGRQSDWTKLHGPVPDARRGEHALEKARRAHRGLGRAGRGRRAAEPDALSAARSVATIGRWSLPPVAGEHLEAEHPPGAAVDQDVVDRCGEQPRGGRRPGAERRDAGRPRRVDARTEVLQPGVVEGRVEVARDDGARGRRARVRDQAASRRARRASCRRPTGAIGWAATITGASASAGVARSDPSRVGSGSDDG